MMLFHKIYFILQLQLYIIPARIYMLFYTPKPTKNSVLYLAAFFPGNAGYHWRVKKWADILEQEGKIVSIQCSMTADELNAYDDNPRKFLIRVLRRRFWQILKARHYETVIVRRELLPYNEYGNHFLEKLLRKQCANLILDFDDDLAAAKRQPHEVVSTFGKLAAEDGNSFRNSFHYYDKFIVASNYLKDYVLKYNPTDAELISVIPTCVDYDKYAPKVYEKNHQMVLGWIGGPHNYYLLQNIVPHLNKLAERQVFELHVIADGNFVVDADFPIVNKIWSLENEVHDLLMIDIGLMPLNETEESKGKGGFKLIQYMGLGIVGVASAITINTEIVEDGVNSFLIYNDSEWGEVLEKLLNQEINLEKIGTNARERIASNFTFEANMDAYLRLLK